VSSREDIQELGGLCKLISNEKYRQVSLGFDYDAAAADKLWKAKPRRLSVIPETETKLKELLAQADRKWTLKERRLLAVVIAHAVLHFSEGPWLDEHWDKEHISFFPPAEEGAGVDFARPYLNTMFGKEIKSSVDDNEDVIWHEHPSILALGVILLELEMRASIEERYTADGLSKGTANAATKLTTAQRLLQEYVDETHEKYHRAIQECIDCEWIQDGDERDDEAFRDEVYQRIVAPLEDELRIGWDIKPGDPELTLVFQEQLR
jgi:hypothetical protein